MGVGPIVQIPSIVLPQVWSTGAQTETIDDLVTHESIDIPVDSLQEKMVKILATEVVLAGVPGALWMWIETSEYSSATTAAYYGAIGGGGGALAPLVPVIEPALGVLGTVHTINIPWEIHSAFARVVVQTPVAAALPNAYWEIQALFSAKTP